MEAKRIKEGQIQLIFRWDRGLVHSVAGLDGVKRAKSPNSLLRYTVTDNKANVRALERLGFYFSEIAHYKSVSVPSRLPLRKYQRQAVWFAREHGYNCIIADDMGVGKTASALGVALCAGLFPVLIVCPSYLKWNWKAESRKFIGKDVVILSGTKPHTPREASVYAINYEILGKWKKQLKKMNFQLMVLDEVHYIRNNESGRAKASIEVAKHIPHRIPMSGTPIENKPIDFWTSLHIVDPDRFPFFRPFAEEFSDYRHTAHGWKAVAPRNIGKLYQTVSEYMIRRKKEDVLKELPPKQRQVLPVVIPMKEYTTCLNNFRLWYAARVRKSIPEVITQIEYLKQITLKEKTPQIVQWVENFLDESDERLLVFGIHTDFLHELATKFKCPCITGKTPPKKRLMYANELNAGEHRLCIGNMRAMGTGLNFQGANHVLITELPWLPSEVNQAVDRSHRSGQTRNVFVTFMLAEGTIDVEMWKLLQEREKILNHATDGVAMTSMPSMVRSTINNLLEI